MDADGILNGRQVGEGEQIGVVSNYLDRPNGTTRHLHFDVQVFTRDGWLWVNPYVTLISAYERLIHGRGREIGPHSTSADLAHALGTKAYRAVGNAMNRNPYAPGVPCHRVVGSDGRLTGYAGVK